MFFEFIWFVLMFDFSFSEYTKIPRASLYFDEGKRDYVERQSEFIGGILHGTYVCHQSGLDQWDWVEVSGSEYKSNAHEEKSKWDEDYATLDELRHYCIAECGSQGYNAWRIYSSKPKFDESWDGNFFSGKLVKLRSQSHSCRCSMAQSDPPFKTRPRCHSKKLSLTGWTVETGKFYCPSGTEHAIKRDNDNVVCAKCQPGYYNNKENYVDMLDASKPRYEGWGRDYEPLKKYWAENVYAGRCKACPEGKYQDKWGKTSCKECPTGFISYGVSNKHNTDCVEITCGSSSQPQSQRLTSTQKNILVSSWQYDYIRGLEHNAIVNDFYKYTTDDRNGAYRTIPTWYDPNKVYADSTIVEEIEELNWRRNAPGKGTKYMDVKTLTCQRCRPGTYPEMAPLPNDEGTNFGNRHIQDNWGRQWNFVQTIKQYTSKDFSSGSACYISVDRRCGRQPEGPPCFYWSPNTREYCQKTQVICEQCPIGKTGNGWHCEIPFVECKPYEILVINDAGSAECQTCPTGTFTFPEDNSWLLTIMDTDFDTTVDHSYLAHCLNQSNYELLDYRKWSSSKKDTRYLKWLNEYIYSGEISSEEIQNKKNYVNWLRSTPQSGLEHYYLAWLKKNTNEVNHEQYNKVPSTACFGCPHGKTNAPGGHYTNGLASCVLTTTC